MNDHSWTRENHIYRAISLSPWLKAVVFGGSAPGDFGPGVGHFFTAKDQSLRLRAKAQPPVWDQLGIETTAELPETEPWKGMETEA